MFNSSSLHIRQLSAALLAAGILSGCTMAPTYERPEAPIESAYATETDTTSSTSDVQANRLGWREFFPDQRLQALIAAALENNRDLRISALNMEAARAQYGVTRADQLPNFNVTATDTRARVSSVETSTGQSVVGETYQVGLGLAAFELDFFGRVRSLSNAALASYLATDEARQSAQISLVSQVAQAYLAERSYSEQLDLSKKTLQSREQNYDLAKRRFDVGASSELDLRLSETLVQAARISNATLQRQRDQADNALTLLVGKKLTDLPEGLSLSQQNIVTDIPAGLPSDLLERRPDIRAAEQNLISANANIGAARAAFFPRISLTAGIGSASNALDDLFSAGFSTWSFVPQLTLPIFQGGRNVANLQLSEVRKNIQIATYEKTIQTAFKEVADALSARGTLEEQIKAQDGFLNAQQERMRLTQLRYDNGVASSLDLLDSQRELFSAQQALIQARQLRFNNAIDLYRSLGGGLAEHTDISAPVKQ